MQVIFLHRVNEVRGLIFGCFRGNQRENSLVGTYFHEVCLNLFAGTRLNFSRKRMLFQNQKIVTLAIKFKK